MLIVVAPTVAGPWRGDGTCVILQNHSIGFWVMKIENDWPSSKWATMNVQATSYKKCFQMTPFCLIFQLGHKKRGAVTSPALITDRVGKPITCCGERIVASDDDKPSCKHSQVRHGNPCNGVALRKDRTKNAKKTATKQFPHCHLLVQSTVQVISPTIQSFCQVYGTWVFFSKRNNQNALTQLGDQHWN